MKRPGHCTLCETEVRVIVKKQTRGKKKGEPIQLGAWKDNAWRVSYLMSDGSIGDITLCTDCLGGDIGKIWDKCKERFLWEEEMNESPRSPLQQHAVEKELNRVLELEPGIEIGRRLWGFV